ncbi:MAG: discoidin domain-containing protein [Sphingobacterium sp.]|jgi:hypothetical protein|nr:discoidin domain-containing protein [Sphingobacterium sp.]
MKKRFNEVIGKCLFIGSFLLAVQACKEEELVFPPQSEQEVVVSEKRPTARPSSLTYVSAFNQNIEIYFPKLSDRVTKATITYKDGTEKKLELTKFEEPVIIHLSEYKPYDFAIQYFTNEGTSSKVTTTVLMPLPYEVKYKLDNIQTEPIEGGVKFTLPKTLDRSLKYTINYTVEGEQRIKTVDGPAVESIAIDKLFDETKPISFKLTIVDTELKVEASKVIEQAPGAQAMVGDEAEFTDRSNWIATVSDSQIDDGGGAEALIDNDIMSFWHSQYDDPSIPFPHWFKIDFGKARFISKIGMIRRSGANNGFIQYDLETSLDGITFTKVASNLSFDPTNSNWQYYTLPKVTRGRYVRVTMTKPKDAGDDFTHLGEFKAFGY